MTDKNVNMKVSLDPKDAIDGLIKISDQAQKTSGSLNSSFQSSHQNLGVMSRGLSVFAGAMYYKAFNLISDAIQDGIKESMEFKKQLAAAETIMTNGQVVTDSLRKSLVSLSTTYGTTASAQAKAYYEILSAGIEDTEEATLILNNANTLATGGLADINKTIGLLSGAYSVYGKQMATTSEGVDSLFKTAQIGRTNIEALTNTMGKVLPTARSLGISFDEVGSNIATFSNAGNTTARSVTLLNALMTAISKNGDKLGPTMNAAAVATDGLGVVIDRMYKKTGGSAQELYKILGGRQESTIAAQTLMKQGIVEYYEQLDKYTDKAGTAQKASDKIVSEDTMLQWKKLIANIQAATNNFKDLTDGINSGIKYLNSFFEVDTTGNLDEKINDINVEIERLQEIADNPENSKWWAELLGPQELVVQATKRVEGLRKELALLTEARGKANPDMMSPQIFTVPTAQDMVTSLNKEIDKVKKELPDISSRLGPIEAHLKIMGLEDSIKQAKDSIGRGNGVENPQPGPTDEQIKAAKALSKERLDLLHRTNAEILRTQMEFSAKYKDQAAQDAAGISREQQATNQLYLDNFLAADAAKIQAMWAAYYAEKDVEKQKTLALGIESATRSAFYEKEATDLKTAADKKAEINKIESDAQIARMESYLAASTSLQENRTLFSEQEAAEFDAKVELVSSQDAIMLAKQKATLDAMAEGDGKRTATAKYESDMRMAIAKQENTVFSQNLQSAMSLGNAAIGAGLAFAKKGTRERKNLLRAQVVMDTATAVMRAWSEMGPWLGGAMSALIIAKGAGQLKQIDQQQFAGGGIFNPGGTSITGDRNTARLNDREMILNMQQQRNVFSAINSGSLGSGMSSEVLVDIRNILATRDNSVNIDGNKLNNQLTEINNRRLAY